ncbi:hypothetical protein A2572_04085 [Candidatus Collierbacteria bacterium RIFOXYD1_FULL_40_9]|uniref:ABC transporter domain-containing protein n=1 Tax=Candidatus Collierbacteria bacterium RIFOXYD1_FULL_40_9 TaxID=1817731 RepID=A0A1F5FPJ3_9BACT|nr:MAG: hypothetical protein A2572_04085 [Candidatus Collierbacteria bacterium RIFOXYD1_FULL_40_9]
MISLKVSSLQKSYNQPLIDDISFNHVGDGVVALIGDNGSGKSTFLKILAGLEEQDSGKIEWGSEVKVGYLTQEIDSMPELSGGQKKVALLVDLIYSGEYDVLLLDEPDNHLDIENKQWLAQAIKSFSGLVIMISHDRHLLKQITDYTWLVEDREIRTYSFGYAKFVVEYEKERNDLEHLHAVQEKEHKRLLELVERFRQKAASGPKVARYYHALQKRLARFEGEMVDDPKKKDVKIQLSSKTSAKQIKNKLSILVRNLSFSYGENIIFKNTDFFMEVGDKVALVSGNGTGKSTLIKLILGLLEPKEGTARVGDNLKVGYYSQEHLETLPADGTPISVFCARFPIADYEAASVLKKFYFSKQTIKSKIWTLSGGQKARLQLALFLYTNPDVLILDEPTNHLDIRSVSALEEFLVDYQGSVLLISHDHDLLNNVCDVAYEIKNHQLKLADI